MSNIYRKSALAWLLPVCVCLFFSFAARAEAVDLGDLQPDVPYSIPAYQEVTATYTPSQTGPVKFLWTCTPLTLYSSSVFNDESIVNGTHSYTSSGQMISYARLEAGHTYYVHSAMTIMAGELVIREGDMKIELVKTDPCIDPEDPEYYGGKFSVSSNYRINLGFNCPVTVGNCYLIAGDERERVVPVVTNTSVSFDVNDVIMDFYRRDVIKEGDTMTLRVLQLKDASNSDNKYGDNGRLDIDFTMAAKPAELVSTAGFSRSVTNNPLNSYYFSGDEASVMALEFDKEIDAAKTPMAQITYGNPDNLELGIYNENISGVAVGNVVSFDLSGKLRRRVDMIPGADSSQLPKELYMSFSNIFTADGQRAYTGMVSNPTGFSASFVVNELLYSIAADFSPARGSALKAGDEMEIWIMNGNKIRFDNICIDYTEAGEAKTAVIDNADVKSEIDQDSLTGDDMLFRFAMPDLNADNGSDILVYMAGVICSDGLDHSGDVRGNFVAQKSSVGQMGGDAAALADVYDITGRLVLRNASRDQISSLGKGVYIHNGRKVIIH